MKCNRPRTICGAASRAGAGTTGVAALEFGCAGATGAAAGSLQPAKSAQANTPPAATIRVFRIFSIPSVEVRLSVPLEFKL
jgi:hypothetical protein